MRSYILMAGTALAVSASPALAGGYGAGGALAGMHGFSHGLIGTAGSGHVARATNSLGGCLCSTASSAVGALRANHSIGRTTRSIGGAGLINSVIGLNGISAVGGGKHSGNGQSIGLAGTVTGTVNSAASVSSGSGNGHRGVGLAGTVAGNVGFALAGQLGASHGGGADRGPAVSISVLNSTGGKAGTLANVSVLNRTGTSDRSAINVAALNGSSGSSGRVANVSVLNGSSTKGRSAVNVAVLNGGAGNAGKVVDVAALNGLHGKGAGSTIRIINGVPCLPDGTPLTGAAAKAAMAAMHVQRHHASSAMAYGMAGPSKVDPAEDRQERHQWARQDVNPGTPVAPDND